MGKKDKNKKKGKGIEKTVAKTEKKMINKKKKELAALGEEDIENIVAEIEREEKKRKQVQIIKVDAPSKRINFSFIAHPDKDELILFGGEFFNGQKTFLYNDLFFYNIPNNSWSLVKAPGGPPSRCGHQMLSTAANKGQLWLFGGEFASPTQSQFYHYRDLWVYHMSTNQWEKLAVVNGPSARSGHRMVYSKKHLILFGGYHDNLRDFKYFNDIYSFNTETYTWTEIKPTGKPPSPRSSVNMVPLTDGRILIYGGYYKAKVKKDVDRGEALSDAYLLVPEKNDTTYTKFKWVQTKLGGTRFDARSGMSIALAANNVAYTFGGVYDVEDEEDISSTFLNDFYSIDLGSLSWRTVFLTGKKEIKSKKQKDKTESKSDDDDEDDDAATEEVLENKPTVVADDGIFTVTVGGASSVTSQLASLDLKSEQPNTFYPSPRMNCGLVVKHGVLFLFGGMFEDGDRQLTFNDFYSLDLKKLTEWKTIIANDDIQEWIDSESESGESDSEEDASDSETESNCSDKSQNNTNE